MMREVIRTGLQYTVIHRGNTEGNMAKMWKWLDGNITSGNQKAENSRGTKGGIKQ